jgi:hypothetical protein
MERWKVLCREAQKNLKSCVVKDYCVFFKKKTLWKSSDIVTNQFLKIKNWFFLFWWLIQCHLRKQHLSCFNLLVEFKFWKNLFIEGPLKGLHNYKFRKKTHFLLKIFKLTWTVRDTFFRRNWHKIKNALWFFQKDLFLTWFP